MQPTPIQIAKHMLANEGAGPAWGVRIEDVREGYARIALTITQAMTNGYGTIHGGMIFALADSAFAYACNSRNMATVAQSASVLFLAPAQPGDELVAEAQEIAVRSRSGAYAVTVRTREGTVIAQFQGHSRAVGGLVIGPETHRDDSFSECEN